MPPVQLGLFRIYKTTWGKEGLRVFLVLGMKSRALHMLGQCSTISAVPLALSFVFCFFVIGSHYLFDPLAFASTSRIAGIIGVCHHTLLIWFQCNPVHYWIVSVSTWIKAEDIVITMEAQFEVSMDVFRYRHCPEGRHLPQQNPKLQGFIYFFCFWKTNWSAGQYLCKKPA
jgi:hypothetical protein